MNRYAVPFTWVFCGAVIGCAPDSANPDVRSPSLGTEAANTASSGSTWRLVDIEAWDVPPRDSVSGCDGPPYFSQIEISDSIWSQVDSTHAVCYPETREYWEMRRHQRFRRSADSLLLLGRRSDDGSEMVELKALLHGDTLLLLAPDETGGTFYYVRIARPN